MADNILLNAGSGGAMIAADDVSGVKYQVVKLAVGADGAASLIANGNPLPVSDAGGSITVDNAGTFAVQAAQSGAWNIGTITALTGITNALPAGSNLIGKVGAQKDGTWTLDGISGTISLPTGASTLAEQQSQTTHLGTLAGAIADAVLKVAAPRTDVVFDATTALAAKRVSGAYSGSGDAEVIAAVSAKKVRVLALSLIPSASSAAHHGHFASASTPIFGNATDGIPLDKTGAAGMQSLTLPFNPLGWFETGVNEALNWNPSTTQESVIAIQYIEL